MKETESSNTGHGDFKDSIPAGRTLIFSQRL